MKPTLKALWDAFPTHDQYPTMKDLYTWLGGEPQANITSPGFGENGNTCASRLSVAFNNGGAPISAARAATAGALTLQAADKSRIIYRVAEFRSYMIATLGSPEADKTSP